MPQLPPAHHEISKHDSPHETKDKGKTTKMSQIRIQTKELTTWFLNLPLDESIDNKRTKFEV
jgi:hypothetical protein